MAKLLAQTEKKPLKYFRGDQVEGKIVALNQKELVVDLGTKSEGVINKRDFSPEVWAKLKIGDQIKAYVLALDNASSQIILTTLADSLAFSPQSQYRKGKNVSSNHLWQKAFQLKQNSQAIKGKVIELNKGGLIVEAGQLRGFLPFSQLRLANFQESKFENGNLESLLGQEITLSVIEADPKDNRLIFSGKVKINDQMKKQLGKFQAGEEIRGKIAVVTPFALFLDLGENIEGLVLAHDVSWDKLIDLSQFYRGGEEVSAKIKNVDETGGRLILSLKQLEPDPFAEIISGLQTDDVVKGLITNITQNGIDVQLEVPLGEDDFNQAEGFLPSAKIDPGISYQVGEQFSFLVDNIDQAKRKVILAPFITSTFGLIYK